MTATSYVTLDSDDLGANKILRAATMSALDGNPLSIAQRGPSAPWLNGIGAIETITSGSGNWTVPAGVYRIKVTAVGGGGGEGGPYGGISGTATTFGTITAGGGVVGGTGGGVGIGGSATGGDINIPGGHGGIFCGGGSLYGTVYGGGAPGDGATKIGGGGGGTAIKVFSVEPGDLIAYAVGTGATDGIIIIEY